MKDGLSARGIEKTFGATRALSGVDLDAPRGQVTAVLGQNGAGKSTLMTILAGAQSADRGTMTLDGAPYAPRTPLEAKAAGVAMVHQELSLCPHLSVAENILLGALPTRLGLVDWKETERLATLALEPLAERGAIDVRARVSEISPPNQQIVEIARALSNASTKVIIFDEPTSSLARADIERLFSRILALKERGFAVLYLSHFLEEVKQIADRFVVLRDGKTVGEGDVATTSIPEMVELLAGKAIENLYPRSARTPNDEVLSLHALGGVRHPKSATLALRRGEVVGIAGLLGAGRTELLRAIFGLDEVKSGRLTIKTLSGPRTPSERWAEGVGMLSEDRKSEGLATSLSIAENLTLTKLGGFFVAKSEQADATRRWIERLRIKAREPDQRVAELSGGNQQKIAVARLLHHEADVLLLDEPTRGIDVESKAQIYALIDEAALAGKAVLMVSSYLPELIGTCDRIYVMRRGELGEPVLAQGATEHSLLLEAMAT